MAENRDVVVVGGGAAGLSAAPAPGRARRRTLMADAGGPRNAVSAHLQGCPSRGYRAGAAIDGELLLADLDAAARV